MRKIVLTFGLIAGAILSAMMLITLPFHDEIGFDKSAIVGYTTMVLAFLMVFFGVRSYRDNVAGGSVTFGRAFMVGLMITAVATVCYVATWELVGRKLAPDYVDKYAAYAVEKARKSGATDAQIAAKTKEMTEFKEMYKNPLINIAFALLEPLPVGLLFTLVAAGVLSRKRRTEGVGGAGGLRPPHPVF
jgi:prepilin signal peptidase PulO-like enzyme (type II secretory pathway)